MNLKPEPSVDGKTLHRFAGPSGQLDLMVPDHLPSWLTRKFTRPAPVVVAGGQRAIDRRINVGIMHVRRDHHEWCTRTLELADTTARHDTQTLSSQAWWAIYDGDPDRAVALGELAMAADGPGTATFARCATVVGQMGAGRTDAAIGIAAELRSTLPTRSVPRDRQQATMAILVTFDPVTITSDADAALAAARTIGAPRAVADVLRLASVQWYLPDPPDFQRMIADLDEAIRLHESVDTPSIWERLFLTWARTYNGDEQAVHTFGETIRLAYDKRHWAGLEATLEAAPVLLSREAPAVAAMVYGRLEKSKPPWGQTSVALRALATEAVAAIPDNETHRARGAVMGRHEIVALTLAALDNS